MQTKTHPLDTLKKCADCHGSEVFDTGIAAFKANNCKDSTGSTFSPQCKVSVKMMSKALLSLDHVAHKGKNKDLKKLAKEALAAFKNLDASDLKPAGGSTSPGTDTSAGFECNTCTAILGRDKATPIETLQKCADCSGTESFDTGLTAFRAHKCKASRGQDYSKQCLYAVKMMSKAIFEASVLAEGGNADAQKIMDVLGQLDKSDIGAAVGAAAAGSKAAASPVAAPAAAAGS